MNTASACGFTPQYKSLEELYKKHKEEGLVILGFPCNQFGSQEKGGDDEIKSFCELNYDTSPFWLTFLPSIVPKADNGRPHVSASRS